MDLDKLQAETARLRLEAERRQLNWEGFLRKLLLFFLYLGVVSVVLSYFFFASSGVILMIISAFLLWQIGDGVKLWLELKAARNSLQNWKQTVNLANQELE